MGCFAPVDQFSSCDNLLRDDVLRIFMWILGGSALFGNLFVIGLRVFRKKVVETTRIQSQMITNLAMSDLLMGVYMMIIAGADLYYRGDYALNADSWRDSTLCRLAGFLSAFASEVSVFIIMLISIDRVICIVFSHHSCMKMSSKTCIISLAIIWALALILALIPAFTVFGQFYGRSSVCLGLPLTTDRPPGWEYSISLFLGLNLVCFLITALCYIVIYVVVHRSASNVSKSKESERHT